MKVTPLCTNESIYIAYTCLDIKHISKQFHMIFDSVHMAQSKIKM